jgi:hypothetical protein
MFHKIERDGHMLSPSQVFELDPKGGRTRCQIYELESTATVVDVEIRCHPLDHYCKRIGREISLRLALRELKAVRQASAAAVG